MSKLKKLLFIIAFLLLCSNTYALTKQEITSADVQPWLWKYVRNIFVINQYKIVENNMIIAESNIQGDIYFYKSNISGDLLEDVIRHEIGHLVWWQMGLDPWNNSEEHAELFKDVSKTCNSEIDLIWKMGYWKMN